MFFLFAVRDVEYSTTRAFVWSAPDGVDVSLEILAV